MVLKNIFTYYIIHEIEYTHNIFLFTNELIVIITLL